MRLLLLAKRTAAHGIGGLETHARLWSRAAVESGHEVVLITTAHPAGLSSEVHDGVRVEYLPGTPPGIYSREWWKRSTAAVRRFLDQGFGDLLLSISLAGYGVASARLPTPHYAIFSGESLLHLGSEWHDVSGLRDLLLYPARALSLCHYAWLERRLWGLVTAVLATYDGLYDSLHRRGWPVLLCYGGTDPRLFRPDPTLRAATRAAMGIPADARVLLMVATVNRQKGIWLGIEAFQRLAARWPDLHCVVVGDGPDRPRLVRGLAGGPFASRVHWVGQVPFEGTPPYYAASDLLLYPTLRAEGLPTAIMEGMAAGLAVVASDRGGVSSAVRDGETGLLLADPAAGRLVEAIERLLGDPGLASRLAGRGRELAVSVFDVRLIVPRLLEDLASRSPASGGRPLVVQGPPGTPTERRC